MESSCCSCLSDIICCKPLDTDQTSPRCNRIVLRSLNISFHFTLLYLSIYKRWSSSHNNWTIKVYFCWKILNLIICHYLTLLELTLTFPQDKLKNECHHQILRPKWPIKHVSHGTDATSSFGDRQGASKYIFPFHRSVWVLEVFQLVLDVCS